MKGMNIKTDTDKGITAQGLSTQWGSFYFSVRKDAVSSQGQALTEAKAACSATGTKCMGLVPYHFTF